MSSADGRGNTLTPRYLTGNPARDLAASYSVRVVVFLALHMPLALAMRAIPVVATLHALATLAVGLFFLAIDSKPDRVILVTAYMAGAEILWRGLGASVFYEYGKYAVSLLLILAVLKYHRLGRADKRPLLYFVLLLPSVLLMPKFDRRTIAFDLAGPFALATAAMFFSTVILSMEQFKRVWLALVAPALGLGFVATFVMLSTGVAFTGESIKATAAGTGPNQVSSILGLGALAAFAYALTERGRRLLRLALVCLAMWLVSQAMLTFSRGGVWTMLAAAAAAGVYLTRDRRSRGVFLLLCAAVFLLTYFVVFPYLDRFSGGMLARRFQDLDPTGRYLIIRADLSAFAQHPLLGLGVYQSVPYHAAVGLGEANAHTEYSRMLAEHGSLGLLALLILLQMSLGRFTAKLAPQRKAYGVALTVWALLFMLHSATRLVAPSFAFGLAAASVAELTEGGHAQPA